MSSYALKGLSPWLLQRVSAVYIAAFILYVSACVLSSSFISYYNWLSWLYSPHNTVLIGVFSVALLFHAWIGMRDIVLDYIHHFVLRIVFLISIVSVLFASGFWITKILLLPLAG